MVIRTDSRATFWTSFRTKPGQQGPEAAPAATVAVAEIARASSGTLWPQ